MATTLGQRRSDNLRSGRGKGEMLMAAGIGMVFVVVMEVDFVVVLGGNSGDGFF